jgi:hypothetical protein
MRLRELRNRIAQILVEDKVADLKKSNPEDRKLIDQLAERDPSGKQKYLAWMFKQAKAGAKLNDILPSIEFFHKNSQRFEKRDINAYDAASLEDAVKSLAKKKTKSQAKTEGAEKVFEDDADALFYIKDKHACMTYGAGTKWCITMENAPYWDDYTGSGVMFYFLINKILPTENPRSKIALAVYPPRPNSTYPPQYEIYDAMDKRVSQNDIPLNIFTVIESHLQTAEKPKVDALAMLLNGRARAEQAVSLLKDDEIIGKLTDKNVRTIMRMYVAGDSEGETVLSDSSWAEIFDNWDKKGLVEKQLIMIKEMADWGHDFLATHATKSSNPQIRIELAKQALGEASSFDAWTKTKVLNRLADDDSEDVRLVVADSTDRRIIVKLMFDPDVKVRALVAANAISNQDIDIIMTMAEHEAHPGIKKALTNTLNRLNTKKV